MTNFSAELFPDEYASGGWIDDTYLWVILAVTQDAFSADTDMAPWLPEGTRYITPPEVGEAMGVKSSDVLDAGVFLVDGLDANFNWQRKIYTLVAGQETDIGVWARINAFQNFGAADFAGNVDVAQLGGGIIYSRIVAGSQVARQGVYSVPAGWTAFGKVFFATMQKSTGVDTNVAVILETAPCVDGLRHVRSDVFGTGLQRSGSTSSEFPAGASVPVHQRTDIFLTARASADPNTVFARVGFRLIKSVNQHPVPIVDLT